MSLRSAGCGQGDGREWAGVQADKATLATRRIDDGGLVAVDPQDGEGAAGAQGGAGGAVLAAGFVDGGVAPQAGHG